MALHLAVLVTEVVATLGLVVLEAFGRFTETLRSPTVGFQLGHDQSTPVATVRRPHHAAAPGRTTSGRFQAVSCYFFFGANTMTICLPSMSGFCSTTLCAARSSETRARRRRPISWCTISRPRNRKVTLAL